MWWEGLTAEPPAHAIDWRAPRLDARVRDARRPMPTPGSRPRRRSVRRSRPSGRTRAACRSRRCCSAVGGRASSRSCTRRATGSTACSSARRCPRRRPPRRSARLASCGGIRWRCSRSAGTTWRITSATGCRWRSVTGAKLPRIFYVNWFRKDENGKFLWPGFGENSRVLAWIFRRCEGKADAVDTAIGLLPLVGEGGIDTEGLDVTHARRCRSCWRSTWPAGSSSCRRCTSTTPVRREAPRGAQRAAQAARGPAERLRRSEDFARGYGFLAVPSGRGSSVRMV